MDDAQSSMRSSLGRNLTHGMLDALGRAIVTGGFSKIFPTEADLTIVDDPPTVSTKHHILPADLAHRMRWRARTDRLQIDNADARQGR